MLKKIKELATKFSGRDNFGFVMVGILIGYVLGVFIGACFLPVTFTWLKNQVILLACGTVGGTIGGMLGVILHRVLIGKSV